MTTTPNLVTAASVRPLQVIGEEVRVLLSAARSGGLEVFLQDGPEGVGPPPHRHAWDEAYFVIEGALDVTIAGAVQRLGPGDFVFVPGGTVHAYRNASGRTRILTMTSAAGAAAFFAAMDREVAFPPDLGVAVAVAGRNGVEVVLPPAP